MGQEILGGDAHGDDRAFGGGIDVLTAPKGSFVTLYQV
jgi:hypothetical protein